jgi:1-acyl-sn-glycerol-3-phosphate acyltransferase
MNILLVKFFQYFLRIFFGISVDGHLPPQGKTEQCIIVANHNSHLDVFLISFLLSNAQMRLTHAVAAEDFFNKGFFGRMAGLCFNPVLIKRQKTKNRTENPLQPVYEALDDGKSLIVFPEGTRGNPGQLSQFKRGIGFVAQKYPSVPIYSAVINGVERAWGRGDFLPLPLNCHIKLLKNTIEGNQYVKNKKDLSESVAEKIALDLETLIKNNL